MMVQAKRINIFMIEVNRLLFFFSLRYFLKDKRKHVLRVSIEFCCFIETLVRVWENLNKLWKHTCLLMTSVSIVFLVLPNSHSCFYKTTRL